MGIGSVDPNFGGNRYGHTAVLGLAVKIAKEFDTDVHFEIVNGNHQALESAKRGSLHLIDTQSWVSARRKKKSAKYPLWGNL